MSNRPYGQKQSRRQAREVKAIGCIRKGVIVIKTPWTETVLPR